MDKPDWEVNPDKYAKNEDGSFILKKDGTPKKKTGRSKGSKGRGYTYHSETKAKLAAKRAVREKKKKLKDELLKLSTTSEGQRYTDTGE